MDIKIPPATESNPAQARMTVLGDAIALTGTKKQGNLSDGPPHGYGWQKGAGESDDEGGGD